MSLFRAGGNGKCHELWDVEPEQEPRLPAGLWAAPGEGKAASSAPAGSHLVNTINNVSLAPCTSLWRARRELTELQLETGLGRASAAAPKHTVGLKGTLTPHPNPAAIPALAAKGLEMEGTEQATTPRQHMATRGSSYIDSQCQLQRGSGKMHDGHQGSIRK